MPMNVSFFTELERLDLQLTHHLMRKLLTWGLEKSHLKLKIIRIVRNCNFLWCTKTEL